MKPLIRILTCIALIAAVFAYRNKVANIADMKNSAENGQTYEHSLEYLAKREEGPGPELIDAVFAQPDAQLVTTIEAYVAAGHDLDFKDKHGQRPLSSSFRLRKMASFYKLIELGADPATLNWPDGFMAVATGSLDAVQAAYPDANAADQRSSKAGLTPFLFAVSIGRIDVAEYLLPLTPDEGRIDGREQNGALYHAIEPENLEMIDWLLANGFDVNQASQFGETALHAASEMSDAGLIKKLLDAGADVSVRNNISASLRAFPPTYEGYEPDEFGDHETIFTPMNNVDTPESAVLLYRAGAPLRELSTSRLIAQFAGADRIPKQSINLKDFKKHKHRVFGKSNPELTNHPFWIEQIRTGESGYIGFKNVSGEERNYSEPAIWNFDRYGQSMTELPDGRWIFIAGEHEDYYDPDFCIYNDVVILDPAGDVQIYSYPEDEFPPTDFHTATLVEDGIYIIGNLGYMGKRQEGTTPVYRLDLESFSISKIETSGTGPGWISRHDARLDGDKIIITGGKLSKGEEYDSQQGVWELSLTDSKWKRVE